MRTVNKKVIVVGSNGQDGRLLYEFLLKKNIQIIGITRNAVISSDRTKFKPVNIKNPKEVFDIVQTTQPDEIYYLAAFHSSSEDAIPDENINIFKESFDIHVFALINFLEAIKKFSPKTKLFYASSSHVFGNPTIIPQDEDTPFNPTSIYGITKAAGIFVCRLYRNTYGMFVSTGIIYNHESHYRSSKFLSKKIVNGAIKIKKTEQNRIVVGNLNARIDWGFAPDYINAFYKILNDTEKADDFIIATGESHSVLDFIKITFNYLKLDWKEYVIEDRNITLRTNSNLIGNPQKIKNITGWQPTVSFELMIKNLLLAEGVSFDE